MPYKITVEFTTDTADFDGFPMEIDAHAKLQDVCNKIQVLAASEAIHLAGGCRNGQGWAALRDTNGNNIGWVQVDALD